MQGRAKTDTTASTKVEPKSQGVNIGAVSEIGIHQVNYNRVPIYEGRGIEAPTKQTTIHQRGSQSRNK